MQKWPAHRRLAEMVPTPTAQLYGYNRGGAAGRTGKARPSLEALIGGINIALREWLMGWPMGWANSSAPLATDRFLEWQRSHGVSSRRLREEIGK